jgi:hypothetical protein
VRKAKLSHNDCNSFKVILKHAPSFNFLSNSLIVSSGILTDMDSVCLVIPYFSQDLPFFSAAIGSPNLLQIVLNLNILFEHSISDISARKKA